MVIDSQTPTLPNIKRVLENSEHELDELAQPRPANGAEITLAYRKVQEAIMYVEQAIKKAS